MKNPVQILAEMTRGLALSGLMVILVVLLAGCAQPVRLAGEAQLPVDFSGHWEVDYRASDDLQDKIQHLYRLAKDAAMRQQAAARMGQNVHVEGATGWSDPMALVGMGQLTVDSL